MKKVFFALLALIGSFLSCSNDKTTELTTGYIERVEIISPVTYREAEIDNFIHTISLSFPQGEDLTQVQLQFILGKGASMIAPTTTDAVYDLTKESTCIVKGVGKQLTYKIKAKHYFPEINDVFTWRVDDSFGKLPAWISVFRAPDQLCGKNAVAYIAVADMNNGAAFNVIGEKSGLKTPAAYYDANNKPSVILNAGYFYSNNALSMICRNGEIICPNIQSMTRSNGTNSVPFYPTRSVFAQKANGSFAADWVYTTDGVTYAYPNPSPNKSGSQPQPQPSATFPQGASLWASQTAVGAGPMLLKNGDIMNTWEAELCDDQSGIGATINNPRSAVGITRFNHLVLFVCEGRNMTPSVPGLTLEEVARVMKELGCIDAINLDGGGSSCMLINGKETIKPSDKAQRSVSSCITLN